MDAIAKDRWFEASAVPGGTPPLSDEQVTHWRERGHTFVAALLPARLIETLTTSVTDAVPAAGSDAAERVTSFGSKLQFPSNLAGFNELTLHPALLEAIAQLLDTAVTDLRLTQSTAWPKYGRRTRAGGRQDNQDQRIHVDYPNHTLVHPPEWHRPEAVEVIVYLGDVEHTGGPTAVVPRAGPDDPHYQWPIVNTPGVGDLLYVNDRQSAEAYLAEERPGIADWRQSLYDAERYVRFHAGDVLLYRHDTWHRGTPMKEGTLRLAHNLTYRRADAEWISTLHPGWAWSAYRPDRFFERLIATASLEQRAVLGFPQPGSRYWTRATIAAIEARHGPMGMDLTPYRDALGN
ncbi:MAG: hypothetical protein CMQ24_08880 [Gammaproteobacteria bacterium]|nr:hypothetical protein [Gammaproteobacteria bacterium]